jgi:hypothetical protein
MRALVRIWVQRCRISQRKEPVVSGPQQQHGSVVTAQLLCGANGVFGVDGAKKADRVTADSSIGQESAYTSIDPAAVDLGRQG